MSIHLFVPDCEAVSDCLGHLSEQETFSFIPLSIIQKAVVERAQYHYPEEVVPKVAYTVGRRIKDYFRGEIEINKETHAPPRHTADPELDQRAREMDCAQTLDESPESTACAQHRAPPNAQEDLCTPRPAAIPSFLTTEGHHRDHHEAFSPTVRNNYINVENPTNAARGISPDLFRPGTGRGRTIY